MGWRRKLGIGGAVVAGLLVVAGGWAWFAKPWQPPIVVAEPGAGGVRVTDNGLLANFYAGNGTGPYPAILMLGGSEGGLNPGSPRMARILAARGYAVLALSYFRAPGQPGKLENIPLEYFGRALAWLRTQPGVDRSRIGVIGGSKGAEAALLIATRHPELKAVVAAMPSSVVWAGIDWNFGHVGSSWSENGKPLPWLALGKFDFDRVGKEGVIAMYGDGLKTVSQHPETVIPVERTTAPVLLICGEADRLWPSCPMARQIAARAAAAGHPKVTLLAYADAGHAVQGLPRLPSDPKFDELAGMGGSAVGNNRARQDNWPKILAFLDATLQPASR